MGIPSYFSFLIKNHANIVKKLCDFDKTIHNLYLDSNSIVYDSLRKISKDYSNYKNDTEFEKELIKQVCLKIEEYILTVKPENCVYIAFDGVAPIAKLEQQRNRRHKSQLEAKIFEKLNISKEKTWNKTAITPGTNFMKKLNKNVAKYFNKKEKQYNVSKIIFSGSDERGEGEHKLFGYIRKNKYSHESQTTIIYGLDADLIMLSLNHLRICKKIYLYREAPEFIGSINSDLNPDEGYLLNINELGKEIVLELNNNRRAKQENEKNKLYDYIFLCFFLGNDFLPHFPSINIRTNGIQILLNAYKDIFKNSNVNKGNLTNGTKIYWGNVYKLIDYLAENEYQNIITEYKIKEKWEKRVFKNETDDDKKMKYLNIPIKNRTTELFINPRENYWQKRYYEKLFMRMESRDLKQNISKNYLEGLEWVINYYSNDCIDWTWHYKYNYPPLLQDLKKYTPRFNTTFITNHGNNDENVSELVQLAYVLPRNSLNLLGSLEKKLVKQLPNSYLSNFKLEWAFCKYIWESHVLLPYMDIEKLKNIIEESKIKSNQTKEFFKLQ